MSVLIRGGWLTVNRACNLRCPWCYGSSSNFDIKVMMSFELARNLLDLMKGLGIHNVVILGGEPTIYPHLTPVLKYATSLGINPVIVTNGLRLANADFVVGLRSAGLQGLTISLKTTDPEQYDRLAYHKGAFEEVCQAVQNTKNANLGINISVTLVKSFSAKFDQLVSLLEKLSPSSVSIDMGSPVITESSVETIGILDPFELRDAVTILHQKLKRTGLKYGFNVSIPLCILDPQTKKEIISEGRILTTCHVPKGQGLVFDPEGEVILCNHFLPFPMGRFGVDFMTPEEFSIFWKSEKLTAIRDRSTLYPHEQCRSCLDWNVCGGGCFVKWLHWNPEKYILRKEVNT